MQNRILKTLASVALVLSSGSASAQDRTEWKYFMHGLRKAQVDLAANLRACAPAGWSPEVSDIPDLARNWTIQVIEKRHLSAAAISTVTGLCDVLVVPARTYDSDRRLRTTIKRDLVAMDAPPVESNAVDASCSPEQAGLVGDRNLTRDEIELLQGALLNLGFKMEVDGVAGKGTLGALQAVLKTIGVDAENITRPESAALVLSLGKIAIPASLCEKAEQPVVADADADADAEEKVASTQTASNSSEELQEKETDVLADAQATGFDRKGRAATFETAGLRIGSSVPESLNAKSFPSSRYQVPPLKYFFYAEVPNGAVAFQTANGEIDGPIVFFARSFAMENIDAEDLLKAVLEKVGTPSLDQRSRIYWWHPAVPGNQSRMCKIDEKSNRIANAVLQSNGRWTGQPVYLDLNKYRLDCGIVAALKLSRSSRSFSSFAVVDTSWAYSSLVSALEAQKTQQDNQPEKAQQPIDF